MHKRPKVTHKEMMEFSKINIEKRKFHSTKESIEINDVNIDNILVSNKYHVRKNFQIFCWLCKSF